jgi:hypothetical protein
MFVLERRNRDLVSLDTASLFVVRILSSQISRYLPKDFLTIRLCPRTVSFSVSSPKLPAECCEFWSEEDQFGILWIVCVNESTGLIGPSCSPYGLEACVGRRGLAKFSTSPTMNRKPQVRLRLHALLRSHQFMYSSIANNFRSTVLNTNWDCRCHCWILCWIEP